MTEVKLKMPLNTIQSVSQPHGLQKLFFSLFNLYELENMSKKKKKSEQYWTLLEME